MDRSERAGASGTGRGPAGGFAAVIPELDVTSLDRSLWFWCGLLGFTVAYDRPAARFAFLVRNGAQVMLCERNGNWEVGTMEPPFGRGINLQIEAGPLEPILNALRDAAWPLYEPPRDAWYRAGHQTIGQREVLVQDPDGYLLRFAEALGIRQTPGPTSSDAAD